MSNDPFEVSKVKVPKIATGLSRGQKAGRKVKNAANAAYGNATSRRAMNPSKDSKFGSRPPRESKIEGSRLNSFGLGAAAGTIAGTLVGDARHGGQTRQDYRMKRQVNKAFKMPKRPHLITEAGTKTGKTKWGDRPGLRPGYLAAGAAAGGALGYTNFTTAQKDTRKDLKRAYNKQQKAAVAKRELERYTSTRSDRMKMRAKDAANVGAQTAGTVLALGAGGKALNGARGKKLIPGKRGLIAAGAAGGALAAGAMAGKYEKQQYRVKKNGSRGMAEPKKASGGRIAAGAVFSPYHGLAAGKKGHKLRAAGNEYGGNLIGGAAGGLAATVATRGKSPGALKAGSVVGALAGGGAGTVRAQKKGHYKVQKNNTLSAFGVDHGY